MDLNLTSKEGDVLIEVLEARDRSLREKITHVRKVAPKKALKEEETVLEKIIEKLELERASEQGFSDLWW